MELRAARAVKEDLERIFTTRTRGGRRRRFAIGLAPAPQQAQYEIALRAPAPEDLSEDDLEIIRRRAGQVDLRYTGEVTPLAASSPVPDAVSGPLRMGSSVAHYRGHAGSLGFFARRNSDETIGFVSNNHVIALCDGGKEGDDVLYPAPTDGGVRLGNAVARLVDGYPRIRRTQSRVDCAFARLLPGVAYDASMLEPGQHLSPCAIAPELSPEVTKIGRTTGATHGRISAFEFDGLSVAYSLELHIPFGGQIEIESLEGSSFSAGGDSGSLVYSRQGHRPIGLLFAASATGGPSHTPMTYANPIGAVLKALGISFLTPAATLEQARAAKAVLAKMLEHVPELQGLGIAPLNGGFGLKLNLARQVSSVEIPSEIDGVPVSVAIVGGIRAL